MGYHSDNNDLRWLEDNDNEEGALWDDALKQLNSLDENGWLATTETVEETQGTSSIGNLAGGLASAKIHPTWYIRDDRDDYVDNFLLHNSPSKKRKARVRQRGSVMQLSNKQARGEGSTQDPIQHNKSDGWELWNTSTNDQPEVEARSPIIAGRVSGPDGAVRDEDDDNLEAYIEAYQGERAAFIRIRTHVTNGTTWRLATAKRTSK
ncbi:hypothetical protein AAF712_004974 [Marasmius tenuissimus]|uniref:Uncharacterized protein n=1 Tax=Marasmius tenuissimus TaxID=585030 RepID=A0ABR3A284_9AGAR